MTNHLDQAREITTIVDNAEYGFKNRGAGSALVGLELFILSIMIGGIFRSVIVFVLAFLALVTLFVRNAKFRKVLSFVMSIGLATGAGILGYKVGYLFDQSVILGGIAGLLVGGVTFIKLLTLHSWAYVELKQNYERGHEEGVEMRKSLSDLGN